jgi:hypothetical protein
MMFVQRDREAERRKRARHFKRADSIHVRSDDRHAAIVVFRMLEAEFAHDIDPCARGQCRALGADQNVIEVELDVLVDMHEQ